MKKIIIEYTSKVGIMILLTGISTLAECLGIKQSYILCIIIWILSCYIYDNLKSDIV
jgi:hypothetical protein